MHTHIQIHKPDRFTRSGFFYDPSVGAVEMDRTLEYFGRGEFRRSENILSLIKNIFSLVRDILSRGKVIFSVAKDILSRSKVIFSVARDILSSIKNIFSPAKSILSHS